MSKVAVLTLGAFILLLFGVVLPIVIALGQ